MGRITAQQSVRKDAKVPVIGVARRLLNAAVSEPARAANCGVGPRGVGRLGRVSERARVLSPAWPLVSEGLSWMPEVAPDAYPWVGPSPAYSALSTGAPTECSCSSPTRPAVRADQARLCARRVVDQGVGEASWSASSRCRRRSGLRHLRVPPATTDRSTRETRRASAGPQSGQRGRAQRDGWRRRAGLTPTARSSGARTRSG